MLTIEDIQKMTPEEVATMNKFLYRRLAKQIAFRVAVVVAVQVAVTQVIKKIDSK